MMDLITSYIKMLDLLELEIPNQSYGYSDLNKSQPSTLAWMLLYEMIATNFEGRNTLDLGVPCDGPHYKLYKNA